MAGRGTARVRFRAIVNNPDGSTSQSLLPVQDRDGVRGLVEELILSGKNPIPATPPEGGPTPDFLNKKPALSSEETTSYYFSVGIGPTGEGANTVNGSLSKFRARYFDISDGCKVEGHELTYTKLTGGCTMQPIAAEFWVHYTARPSVESSKNVNQKNLVNMF